MPDDLQARVDALTKAIEDELESLWADLPDAIDRAPDGSWSRTCDDLVERIKGLTKLVGPMSWGLAPLAVLESGLYQRIHADLGVDAPVDMDEVTEALRAGEQQHEDAP